MARQQTLKQAFAAVGRKTKAPTRQMRQSTLNFDGCAPALRDDSDDDGESIDSCGCSDHTATMNDYYECICSREDCDFENDPESCNCNACWEDRIDQDPTLCAVRSGFFHRHQENAVADAFYDDSRWDDQFLAYYDEQCKPKVLKQFVLQRGLLDAFPAGVTLKYYYIKELLTADSVRVFRFLDLPAEMRNEVYGYLLAPQQRYTRRTQILRTCKAIYNEANEILYADNVISCAFSNRQDSSGKRVIINHRTYSGANALELSQLPGAIDHYPSFLARLRKLEIEIHMDLPYAAANRNPIVDFVRSALLALASILMEGGRLKGLRVRVSTTSGTLQDKVVASVLYPLRRLRNTDLTFAGDVEVPDFLRNDMAAELRLREPVFNTLMHCRLILSNAEAYLRLIDVLDPLPSNNPQRMGNSRAAQMARQVRYLQGKMVNRRSLFADWLGEVKVQTHLAKLQKQIEEVFPNEMRKMVEGIGKATSDRQAYQQEHQRWTIGDLSRAKSPSPDPAPL
ncbi:hypothetical protein M409DRAFT_30686 [Zasmidium cellare ATCC 36951]|uniref:F-box domain-containing protein n=1 Tax=Zasmidium cellare ATCC 36951 TaxID=1080233 RepID=A0A6A6BVL0_ZASCE|nr:uncharacterized protein M409DRAFT_30686 [Zasmidium cellare ATCC 36951]KAF2158811.1 hypothetical protein M409DRAFT_30686 [Zasmidium cellare ATCC 36951]